MAVGSPEESQPPLYEDVIVTTVVKDKDELELCSIWTSQVKYFNFNFYNNNHFQF